MSERTLTDADIEAIVKVLADKHTCRFHVDAEEFEKHWPNLRGASESMDTGKKITLRLVITGAVVFIIGATVVGIKTYVANIMAGTAPPPPQ